MSSTQFQLRQADWPASAEALKQLRETVFIKEQQVPPELEWDGLDETALHLLAETPDGQPIGCARLLPNGQIGRMSVLRSWRNHGSRQRNAQRAASTHRTTGFSSLLSARPNPRSRFLSTIRLPPRGRGLSWMRAFPI